TERIELTLDLLTVRLHAAPGQDEDSARNHPGEKAGGAEERGMIFHHGETGDHADRHRFGSDPQLPSGSKARVGVETKAIELETVVDHFPTSGVMTMGLMKIPARYRVDDRNVGHARHETVDAEDRPKRTMAPFEVEIRGPDVPHNAGRSRQSPGDRA